MADSQRLDKWLWHARVTRTRTLAQKLVEAGRVRVNREKVDAPSRPVKLGDVLTIALDRAVLVWEVRAFAERRGASWQAIGLYADLAPKTPQQTEAGEGTPVPAARPDSRDRREARLLRGKDG